MRKKAKKSLFISLISFLPFLIPVLLIVCFFGGIIFTDMLLKRDGKSGKGILIDKIIHVRSSKSLTYSFYHDGKTYTGNSQEEDLSMVGDSVCVVYLPYCPVINRALKYFDSGETKCDCSR